jgi:hypothetical protein
LQSLSPQTTVLMVFMPFGASALPPKGSRSEGILARCKARFDDLVRTRAKTAVIDHLVDNEVAHDPRYFPDPTSNHVATPYFKIAETEIARVLTAMRP